ncbi:MAG: protein kinase [Acidobacteria bacterium]|nr:protein kinase [Acidobacteriota bacterium]
MIGQTLGHYRILEQIGAGGMGVVYRARDERLDRDVALKVLPAGTLSDETARKRFRKEALTLSKLNHPNIETVFDFDTQDGVDFLVMELIAGVALDQKLVGGALPEKEVLRLGQQLAEGLTAAHEQGVVHRDLKPGNLRLTPDGRLKILDFGLAKLLEPASGVAVTASVTETHAVTGTLPYMAPEQLRGEPADARADVWAAGAVIYEMATGRRPFDTKIPTALAGDIQHKPPPSPRRLKPELSPKMEDVILKCLEKDADNRYQSAKELGVDLRRLAAPAPTSVTAVVPLRKRGRKAVVAASLVLLALVAALAILNLGGLRDRLLGGGATPQIQSIAVLPLENLSGDPEQEYFVDGVTDALITELSKIGAFRVISRTSTMQYKRAKKRLPEIAGELNVEAVLEGSVLRSGRRVRVTVQLIRASNDEHLWAETYDRDVVDILALHTDVARNVVQQVRSRLTPQEQSRLGNVHRVDPEAYEAYLKGRYHSIKLSVPELKKALPYFEESIRKDPNFALGYVGVSDYYAGLGLFRSLAPHEASSRARTAMTKAVQLDDTLAEAHLGLATLAWRYDWDWLLAEWEFARALELNPNFADAHSVYAVFLALHGRVEQAAAELQRARALNPLSIWAEHPAVFYQSRNYDRLIEHSRRWMDMDPYSWLAHIWLGFGYQGKGSLREAIAEYQKALELSEGDHDAAAALAHAYAVTGKRAEAQRMLKELERGSKTRYVSPYMIATIHAGLGQKQKALAMLERAFEEKSPDLSWHIKADLRIDSLRSEPRFQDLLRRMNLPP